MGGKKFAHSVLPPSPLSKVPSALYPMVPPRGRTKGGIVLMDRIPDLPNEEWKAIDGYNGKYLVSNQGRIKSLKHTMARLLTAFPNNKGYYRVCLCQNG